MLGPTDPVRTPVPTPDHSVLGRPSGRRTPVTRRIVELQASCLLHGVRHVTLDRCANLSPTLLLATLTPTGPVSLCVVRVLCPLKFTAKIALTTTPYLSVSYRRKHEWLQSICEGYYGLWCKGAPRDPTGAATPHTSLSVARPGYQL